MQYKRRMQLWRKMPIFLDTVSSESNITAAAPFTRYFELIRCDIRYDPSVNYSTNSNARFNKTNCRHSQLCRIIGERHDRCLLYLPTKFSLHISRYLSRKFLKSIQKSCGSLYELFMPLNHKDKFFI